MAKRKKRVWKPSWAVSSAPNVDASTRGGESAQAQKRPVSLPSLEKIYGKDVPVYYLAGCLYVGGEVVRVRRY